MAVNTTKRSATANKSTAAKAAPAKPVASTTQVAMKPTPSAVSQPTGPEPKLVSATDTTLAEADLKKRELIDLVVDRSGIKKKDAKPVVEAMLAVLGETIASGRELNLQPLGKLRINRAEEKGNGRVIVCKLRQSLVASGSAQADATATDLPDADKETLADKPE